MGAPSRYSIDMEANTTHEPQTEIILTESMLADLSATIFFTDGSDLELEAGAYDPDDFTGKTIDAVMLPAMPCLRDAVKRDLFARETFRPDVLSHLLAEFPTNHHAEEFSAFLEWAYDAKAPGWADVQGKDYADAYRGVYESDADFTRQHAEDTGNYDPDSNWPYNHIDWDRAAITTMFDHHAIEFAPGRMVYLQNR